MGNIESAVRKRARKRNLQRVILGGVAAAGMLGMSLVAPNAIQALEQLGLLNLKQKRWQKAAINRARDRLLADGLLTREQNGLLSITPKGSARLHKLQLRDCQLPTPKRWDKKWRVLIFDIPEKRKGLRDKVRNTLQSIGFQKLQKSVWAYPYPCEDFIALLKADFKIGKDLLYLVVEDMEGAEGVSKWFGLSTH